MEISKLVGRQQERGEHLYQDPKETYLRIPEHREGWDVGDP